MKSSHTRAAIGVLPLLLVLAVAGCDEAAPTASPPPSSSPASVDSSPATEATPTATETGPVEPTLPPDAERDDKTGVEAFVRFYWDVVNYATKTGETEFLSTLDQPSCNGCEGGIAFVDRVYRKGGRIDGGAYRVLHLALAKSPSGHWTAIVHTQIDDQRVVGAGEMDRTYPAGRAKWVVGVARVRGAWSITTLDAQ